MRKRQLLLAGGLASILGLSSCGIIPVDYQYRQPRVTIDYSHSHGSHHHHHYFSDRHAHSLYNGIFLWPFLNSHIWDSNRNWYVRKHNNRRPHYQPPRRARPPKHNSGRSMPPKHNRGYNKPSDPVYKQPSNPGNKLYNPGYRAPTNFERPVHNGRAPSRGDRFNNRNKEGERSFANPVKRKAGSIHNQKEQKKHKD